MILATSKKVCGKNRRFKKISGSQGFSIFGLLQLDLLGHY
jgi:hypothetical protein